MTQQPSAAELAQVRAAVQDLARHAFELTGRVAAELTTALETEATPRRSHLGAVERLVQPVLGDPAHPVQGAGFVAAVGLLEDAAYWLEWFAADAEGRVQRLVTHSEPQGIGFYDYESLPWYVVPRDSGHPHVTGPYVDYLCTEEYTLTFTTPITTGGRFAGVVGADIAVPRAEQLLLPPLCAARARLAVVNDDGRILSSNSGHHVCGDLLPDGWRTSGSAHAIEGLPLSVVTMAD